MKRKQNPVFISSLLLLMIIFFGCSKDETIDNNAVVVKDSIITKFVSEINADSIKKYVQWMQDKKTRFFLNNNRKQIAIDIKNKFIQLGYLNARIDSFYMSANWDGNNYNTWQYNVIARSDGSFSPSNIYVLGAHYDCIVDAGDPFTNAPGANDNASGIAGIIEIARVMKKQAFNPKSTIEFVAFAAEEYDLNGSTDYAQKAKANSANIIMMLNNDMIAYEPETNPALWKLNVMDYTNSISLRTKFVSCGTLYTNLNFTNDNTYNEEGDSYSFFNQNYQSIFIISNSEDTYYHTINDIVSKYNFAYCREVTAVSCALLVQENK